MTLELSLQAIGIISITYFLGAMPFGLFFARWITGKDPREHGSGNIGATNAMRTGGKKVGILTLIADVFKGILPVWLAIILALNELEISLIALAAFLGHIFPIYLKFKGGKGVATMFGVLIPWLPYVAILSFVIWFISFKFKRYVSLSSILAGLALPILAWLNQASPEAMITCLVLGGLMTLRHQSNIQRLINGTEAKS